MSIRVQATLNHIRFVNCFYSFGTRTHSGPGEEQCQLLFDGPGNTLAHAYFPPDGRIHFDDDEYFTVLGDPTGWWWWRKETRSFFYIAVHEIGHALGLRHSNVQGSIMWPTARGGVPVLHQDDIDGIRSLYGKCWLMFSHGIHIFPSIFHIFH